MDEIKKYTFDGKFGGHILIVGRKGCRKTTFVQNLGKNELFGDISSVFGVSKMTLSQEREENISGWFSNQEFFFNYPENIDDFYYFIESFMQRKADYENSELKEQMDLDKLIVMDDVSGHADKSDVFSNFLTVSRKYGMSCVYIFHTVYPNRQNWDMIMPQIYIFNFFPGSVHNGPILRTVSLFANKFKSSYVPTYKMWFSRLYFNISNSKQKQCLTIDTRDINDLGPGKFRTSAFNRIIIIESKAMLVLILSWLQESKHHKKAQQNFLLIR